MVLLFSIAHCALKVHPKNIYYGYKRLAQSDIILYHKPFTKVYMLNFTCFVVFKLRNNLLGSERVQCSPTFLTGTAIAVPATLAGTAMITELIRTRQVCYRMQKKTNKLAIQLNNEITFC